MGNVTFRDYPASKRQYYRDRTRCTRPRLGGEAFEKVLETLNIHQVKTVAMINKHYFNAVRQYFLDFPTLSIDLDKHKICLSRRPCNCSKSMCGHRVIRKIQTWVDLIKVGLVDIDKIYIHGKRVGYVFQQYKGINKIMGNLNRVIEVYIDLQDSATGGFFQSIHNLVVRCNNPGKPMVIFFKNGDIDSCPINVPPFLPTYTNLLRFDQSVFPEVSDGKLNKFLLDNDLHQYNVAERRRQARLAAMREQEWVFGVEFNFDNLGAMDFADDVSVDGDQLFDEDDVVEEMLMRFEDEMVEMEPDDFDDMLFFH
ncbi:unnamed protein product [Bursaphelenchus okinawaensis]|uniref:Uncharacterized protein n=1 Tax=Bursaphelenchus okinawaensis TaxID=465554 RepID=A0A811LKP4_9BILA|nr:unnamed protein product [Bursaphelenchus okinawaensis]CAG9123498.1 unnamed protein product [Bursaphelenchus okinawaensis]